MGQKDWRGLSRRLRGGSLAFAIGGGVWHPREEGLVALASWGFPLSDWIVTFYEIRERI